MGLLLLGLAAWLLPVVAAWIAWRYGRWSYDLLKRGIRTTGHVTVAAGRNSRIQYSVGERTYQIGSDWYVPFSVGETIQVLYLPESPEGGCVHHWQELWMPSILWLHVTVFFGYLNIWYG
jgi:hypothetical protein